MLAADHQDAIRVGRAAIAMAEALGLEEIAANALNTVGVSRFWDGDLAGLEDIERSIASALEFASPVVVRGYINLRACLLQLGELDRAAEAQAEARQMALRFGQMLQLQFLEEGEAHQWYWRGRWDDCLELANRRIAESEAGSPQYGAGDFRRYRALIRLARGDTAGALADARAALAAARRVRDPQNVQPALADGARILCAANLDDEAAELADELLAGWTAAREDNFGLCWVARRLGRSERFLVALDRHPIHSPWKEAAGAVVHEDFARAAEIYAEMGDVSDEAYARLHAGDPESVAKALAFYRSVGATRYVREGEALLAATG
jgi:hypothetical protein